MHLVRAGRDVEQRPRHPPLLARVVGGSDVDHLVACGVEELQLRRGRFAENRVGDELAAGEAEHVAVTGVPAGDPDSVAAGDAPPNAV